MTRRTRPVSWIKEARKDFEDFPAEARRFMLEALSVAAEGQKARIAKPMKGLGAGVFEIALRYRSDADRTVYAVELGEAIWIIHAFQKKSKTGIKTPKHKVDLIRERLKRMKEILRHEQ